MIKIEFAQVIAGTETPTGIGVTGSLRCVLALPAGQKVAGILKRGPVEQVAAEAFCALLLRAWGLNVPEPYLVREGDKISFASADIGYPNLKQRLGLDALPDGQAKDAALEGAMSLAASFASAPQAAAVDEAIDNRDRNLGNILWDGTSEAWIDHAFAFGQYPKDANKLCLMAIAVGKHEEFAKRAVAQALILDQGLPAKVQDALPSDVASIDMGTLVAKRITTLGNRIVDRFPKKVDLFGGV